MYIHILYVYVCINASVLLEAQGVRRRIFANTHTHTYAHTHTNIYMQYINICVYRCRAKVLEAKGEIKAAFDDYKRAMSYEPNNPSARAGVCVSLYVM